MSPLLGHVRRAIDKPTANRLQGFGVALGSGAGILATAVTSWRLVAARLSVRPGERHNDGTDRKLGVENESDAC